MDPVRTHITALIEKYEKRIEEIKNTIFIEPDVADIAEGALNELEEFVEDLKCVRDAVDA